MTGNTRKSGPRGLKLSVDQRSELRFADGAPVLGWRDRQAAQTGRIARILGVAENLLEPSPSTGLHYECNLPSAAQAALLCSGDSLLPDALLGPDGLLKHHIERACEPALALRSFAGGCAARVEEDGARALVRLRWLPLAADAGIGSLWRLYLTTDRGDDRAALWCWTGNDYFFDATGTLLHTQTHEITPLGSEAAARQLAVAHGDDGVTQFPCAFAAVKVRKLKADGWVRRSLLGAELMPGGDVFGIFSDNCRVSLGFAATEPAMRRLAA